MFAISAIILAKNEEENIKDCINSLKFCSELIVIDDDSTDNTAKIAKSFGAKVIKHSLKMNFADQSNFAISKAGNDWVLFVDADERISNELEIEITHSLESKEYEAYSLKRIDYMWGKWLRYGEVGNFHSVRLIKKGSGKWIRRVHQYYKTLGKVGELKNPILHYPHKNLRSFINHIDQWSELHAIANMEEGKRSTLTKIIFYPVGHFINNYIFKLGFLDGMHGLVFALVMASHSYLSWSKLFLIQNKKETVSSSEQQTQ